MLVTVIIPAFNVEEWIAKCLDSVVEQSYQNLEIIVIDDGSTDGTKRVAETYQQKDKRIKLVSRENRGLSATRNEGVQLATGDLVFFVDSDDWIDGNAISSVVSMFNKFQVDIVIFQAVKFFQNTGQLSSGTDSFYWSKIASSRPRIDRITSVPESLPLYPLSQLKVLRRSFLLTNKLQFIEGVNYEDNAFHFEVYSANPKVCFLPLQLYFWRQDRIGQITARPNGADCQTILHRIVTVAMGMANDSQVYCLIAVVRLISKVASQLESDQLRAEFLCDGRAKLAGLFDEEATRRLGRELTEKSSFFHPADIILSLTFLRSPKTLSMILGNKVDRVLSIGKIAKTLTESTGFLTIISTCVYLVTHMKLVRNFIDGVGEQPTCQTKN